MFFCLPSYFSLCVLISSMEDASGRQVLYIIMLISSFQDIGVYESVLGLVSGVCSDFHLS
jgi:hypothetical protein